MLALRPLSLGVRHPRLLEASGSGREARGPVRTTVVRIRPGSAGLPVFGRPRPHRAERSRGRADGGKFSYQPSAISFQPRARADGEKIQLSAFSYQLSVKGPGGRGENSAISLQLSAFSQGAGRTGGNEDGLTGAVFQGDPVYDACCRGFLPHQPARGEHRETSPSCDEDPLGSLRLLGNCRKPGPAGCAAADAP